MNITNTFTIYIDTKPNGFATRPLSIVLKQGFTISAFRGSVNWEEDGTVDVYVMAGSFELFQGSVSDLSGWIRSEVETTIKAGIDWDIKDADALEMLNVCEDWAAHEREHAVGRV